jgi:hypothetical protein
MSRRVVVERHALLGADDDPDLVAQSEESLSLQDAVHSSDDEAAIEAGLKPTPAAAAATAADDNDDNEAADDNDDSSKASASKRAKKKKAKETKGAVVAAPLSGAGGHLDDLIVCATEPVPASSVCTDDVLLRDLSPEADAALIEARRVLRDEIVRGVFRYCVLQVALPESLFRAGDDRHIDDKAFRTTDPTSELRDLAFDESGQQRRLTREQLAQLSRTGSFVVPSRRHPDLEHEWRVSAMLVRGTSNIAADWRHTVAISADQMLCQVPRRFQLRDRFSVAAGFWSIGRGVWDFFALLFGFIEREQRFDEDSAISQLRQLYVLLHLRAAGKPLLNVNYDGAGDLVDAPRDAAADKGKPDARDDVPQLDEARPFAHWPPAFQSDAAVDALHAAAESLLRRRKERDYEPDGAPSALPRASWLFRYASRERVVALDAPDVKFERVLVAHSGAIDKIVQRIVSALDAEWDDRRADELTAAIRAVASERGVDADAALKGVDKELVRQLSAPVASALAAKYNALLLERVERSAALAGVRADVPALVRDALRARWIVRQNELDFARIERIRDEAELKRYAAARPILSQVDGWREDHMDAFRARLQADLRKQRTASVIAELKAAGLAKEAYLMQRAADYDERIKASDRARLKQFKEPKRVFGIRVRRLLSSNWVITKDDRGHYSVDKWADWSASSDHVLWRWWYFVVLLFGLLKNICFYLLVSIVAGPLSLRALVWPTPFYPEKKVNEVTGKIETDTSLKIWSFPALLGALWRNVGAKRAEFEQRPDTGLVGKGVTRIFNVLWWVVFYGLFGTVFLAAFMPAAILISTALSLALLVTAVAWWPVVLLISFLWALLVHDWMHAKYGDKWFPLLSALLLRIGLLGVGRIAVCVLAALVVHPLVALSCAVFACLRAGLRWFWDKLMMLLVLRRRGRVPAANEFLTRRVRGPGITFQCAFQIPTDSALVALRSSLESLELAELSRRVHWIETAPQIWLKRAQRRAVAGLLASYAPTPNLNNAVGGTSEMREMRRQFESALAQRRSALPGISRHSELRQTADDLSNTMTMAEQIVERFVRARILAALERRCPHVPVDMEDADEHTAPAFWKRQSVKAGDFKALTAKLLKEKLGARFLEPLEESDRVIQLEAKDTRLRTIVGDVLSGVVSPPLRANTYAYTESVSDTAADETRIVQRMVASGVAVNPVQVAEIRL